MTTTAQNIGPGGQTPDARNEPLDVRAPSTPPPKHAVASSALNGSDAHFLPQVPPPTFSLYIPNSGDLNAPSSHQTEKSVEIDSHRHQPAPRTPTNIPELHLRTDVTGATAGSIAIPTRSRASAAALSRSNSFQSSYSPGSSAGSPMLNALIGDITPLPSPLISADSPGPWKFLNRTGSFSSRPTSRGSLSGKEPSEHVPSSLSPPSLKKKKTYQELYGSGELQATDGSVRPSNVGRSVSEHFSAAMSISNNGVRSVSSAVGDAAGPIPTVDREKDAPGQARQSYEEPRLKREEYLAKKRGIVVSPSEVVDAIDEVEHPQLPPIRHAIVADEKPAATPPAAPVDPEIKTLNLVEFTALTVPHNNRVTWRGLKRIGQGTFSTVVLATSDKSGKGASQINEIDREKIVAVKIVENGAAGGASKSRIESSLKRELDILKSIKHPSLVHLKAFSVQPTRALLVLTYCFGGDLFDLATEHMRALTPRLVRRMFAELVGALMYLHKEGIVHRDVKLENVLINIPAEEILALPDPLKYNRSITTLTDLGLSRRIDPENPLLTTRCGSEDYAAPEILLGQPYDGRQTDAWALGVLLYGVMESRLPFDPLPGSSEHKMRSRTAHRICRCEWKWVKLVDTPPTLDENGVAEVQSPKKKYNPEWEPGKLAVDGLLRRLRKRVPLEEISKWEWVTGAIQNGLEDPPLAEDLADD